MSIRKFVRGFVFSFAAMVAASASAGVYVRFSFTAVRSPGMFQMSELAVYDKLANRLNLNLTKLTTSGATAADLDVGQYILSHEGTVKGE